MSEKKSTLQDDTCVMNGITYIAKNISPDDACIGCAFWGRISECAETPYCNSFFREDKRDIIWIKKEK